MSNIGYNFSNQTVLVTGGSRGIGREIALQFAAAGARVAVHYVGNQAAAEQTMADLNGDQHMIVQGDIGIVADLERLVAEVVAEFGRIDILINNAGIYEYHKIAEASFDEWQHAWQRIINVNLIGAAHLIYLCAQTMIPNGGGRVVNVSSRGAFRGEPESPAYGASKAGMNAMGQSLAKALGEHNVFVHTVAPGFVETDMAANILSTPTGEFLRNESPLKRVAQPHEVANAVLFCASEESKFMTGCILDVNGASYLRT
ncbi:MAG: SDR family NAD(P)-dependent oxidoreductase [Candidatus Promineifilaceae bacterium]